MGVHVPRTRPPYPPEFRAEAVRLLRSTGRTPQQIADDLGVSRQSVANWPGRPTWTTAGVTTG
jgi:transposase